MPSPFVVGQSYPNREGRYEVISIQGNRMTIRYTDGRTIECNIQDQARILERIQEEKAFGAEDLEIYGDDYGGPSKDADEVSRLVAEVLYTMSPPWPSDITDQVFLRIEHDPKRLASYQKLKKEIGNSINRTIAVYVKQQTGLETGSPDKQPKSRLIESYSRLVPK